MKSDPWSISRSSFGGAFWGFWGGKAVSTGLQKVYLIPWFNFMQAAPCTEAVDAGCAIYGGAMDRISEDFCLVYFWGNPASLMLEKEHSKDHSLPVGRYAWRFMQPYIYISYTSHDLNLNIEPGFPDLANCFLCHCIGVSRDSPQVGSTPKNPWELVSCWVHQVQDLQDLGYHSLDGPCWHLKDISRR